MADEYIEMKDGAGILRKVAAKLLTIGADAIHHQVFIPHFKSRQDTFVAAASGATVDTSLVPCNRFAVQVKGTGAAPTAWEVVLEGSLNGTQFTTIATHKSGAGNQVDGALVWQSAATPAKYFRSRLVSITLGPATNVVVDIIGQAGA